MVYLVLAIFIANIALTGLAATEYASQRNDSAMLCIFLHGPQRIRPFILMLMPVIATPYLVVLATCWSAWSCYMCLLSIKHGFKCAIEDVFKHR